MNKHIVEYTDTFGGQANYSWARRETITMPELTHYGFDGGHGYVQANKAYDRELMRRAKAAVGLTGVRGQRCELPDCLEFRPHHSNTVLFVYPCDDAA